MLLFLYIVYRLFHKFKGIFSFSWSAGNSEDFNVVFFGCSLDQSEVSFNHLGINIMLVCKVMLV